MSDSTALKWAPLKNDRFLRALRKEEVDITPVWMMRQAGRYLPEYRASRKRAGSFLDLCKNPELACEVTLQPLERYPLDAAILFSDILTIPDAMGLGLYFEEGEGPRFQHPVQDSAAINRLQVPDIASELSYVSDAVTVIRKALNGRVPLIGFSGSPWTLATYMIEGGSSKDFRIVKSLLYQNPQALHELLEKISKSVILYLNAQIKAGAQVVQIFDTWGGVLSTPDYREFSLAYMKKIVSALELSPEGEKVPCILFTKNGGLWLEDIAASGCDALGLDWTIEIEQARVRVGKKVALQGNMDPSVLFGTPEAIRQEVRRILQGFGKGPGHIFNLGHGISQFVDPENAGVFISAVHEISAELS